MKKVTDKECFLDYSVAAYKDYIQTLEEDIESYRQLERAGKESGLFDNTPDEVDDSAAATLSKMAKYVNYDDIDFEMEFSHLFEADFLYEAGYQKIEESQETDADEESCYFDDYNQ